MIYLEDYLDTIEALPLDLQRNFTLLRELDFHTQKLYEQVENETGKLKEASLDRKRIIQELRQTLTKSIIHEEEKVALASQTYEMVDKHIRRLDEDLIKFDMDMSSMNLNFKETEKKIKRKIESPPQLNETRKRERRSTRNNSLDVIDKGDKGSDLSENENSTSIPGLDVMPLDPNEPVYCYCGQVSFGEMIGCDNEGCEIEWFHYDCVGLKNPPKGKWYCHECLTKRKKGLLKQ